MLNDNIISTLFCWTEVIELFLLQQYKEPNIPLHEINILFWRKYMTVMILHYNCLLLLRLFYISSIIYWIIDGCIEAWCHITWKHHQIISSNSIEHHHLRHIFMLIILKCCLIQEILRFLLLNIAFIFRASLMLDCVWHRLVHICAHLCKVFCWKTKAASFWAITSAAAVQ